MTVFKLYLGYLIGVITATFAWRHAGLLKTCEIFICN